jgi:hypothetical protein
MLRLPWHRSSNFANSTFQVRGGNGQELDDSVVIRRSPLRDARHAARRRAGRKGMVEARFLSCASSTQR